MDHWNVATNELTDTLKQVVDSAGEVANMALRANSNALYYRFVWEETVKREPEIIRRILDVVLDNPDIGRHVRDDWLARRTAIASAGEDFRNAVRDAADKLLEAFKENELKA